MVAFSVLGSTGNAFAQRARKGAETTVPDIKLREAEYYFIEAEKYFVLEDYAKALVYYQRVQEIEPDNATVYYKIADVLSQSSKTEDLAKAATNIDQALKLEKGNKYFYLLAAGIYNTLGKLDKAEDAYEDLLHNIPGTEEYLYELGALYEYDNKADAAIKTYNRAEAAFGINETSSFEKEKVYLGEGKTAEAIAEGKKLADAFPDEEKYDVSYADLLARNGKKDVAITYLEGITRQNPDYWSAKMLLAGLYRDSGREDDARKLLTGIFNAPEADIRSKIVTLSTYNNELSDEKGPNQDRDKASFVLSLYNSLVRDYPNEETVHVLGGDLYLAIDMNDKAIDEYTKAIDLGAINFDVWHNLLTLELQGKHYTDVVKYADKGLELYPNQGILYYFDGYANYRLHQYDLAIQSLEEARKRMTNDSTLQEEIDSLLGDAYNAQGNYPKSDEAYEAALAINPNDDVVINNYSYYLALRKENLDRAEKLASQLVKDYPDNATYLDTYAWVLYSRDKYKEAKKAIERAIGTGNASATHFEHYGDILFRLGDVDGAVMQWEKAKDLNDSNELLDKKIANRKIYEQ